jgi:hypothetical protein
MMRITNIEKYQRFGIIFGMLITLLIPRQSACQGNPFIYMENDRFMYQCSEFYPWVINYQVVIIKDRFNGFHISPDLHYCSSWPNSCGADYEEWHEQIKDHLIKSKSLGFNMVRLMQLGVSIDTLYDSSNPFQLYSGKYFEQSQHPDSVEVFYMNGKRIPIDDSTQHIMGDLIEEFIKIIEENDLDLKLIIAIGGGGVEETSPAYTAFLSYIAERFHEEPIVFSYDLYNEPGYYCHKYTKNKYLRANTVSAWYHTVKQKAPSHYVTIGHVPPDIFEWDPMILNQDYVSYHVYPKLLALDNYNASNGFKRYKAYIKSFGETISKPWIIGETGLPAVDSINDPSINTWIHPIISSEEEQAWFADSSIFYTNWYGSKGYSWWKYKDVKWYKDSVIKANQNFYGLVRRFSDEQNHKPAGDVILNFDLSVPCTFCVDPPNMIDPNGYNNLKIYGKIKDENGLFIKNAMIYCQQYDPEGPSEQKYLSTYSFSDDYGNYEIHTDSSFPGSINCITFSYPGMSRWDSCNTNVEISGELNISLEKLQSMQLPAKPDFSTFIVEEGMIETFSSVVSLPYNTIYVRPQSTMIVTGEIYLKSGARIVVERGGKLIVDGGTLSGSCTWNGIEVWGNPTLPSTEEHQGSVYILNGGTIENAIVGIRTVKTLQAGDGEELVEYNYAGGIVKSVNGRFINNQAAVRFYKYPATGYSHVNTSFFNGTLFETNEDYFGATNPGPFAYLDNINMVKFNVCEFVNNLGTSNQQTGLYSLNSQFLVNGFESGNNLQYTLFKDLWYGIYATANNPSRFADIRLTKFDLCHRGLYISGMTNARITSNQFNTNAHYKPLPLGGYGMYLNNSTGYWVEDNDYYHEGSTQVGIGIIVHNSGSAPNEIYNNRFTNLTMGVSAQEHNGNVFTTAGLQILCNDFVQCAADILVPRPGRPEWGIARNQGANSTDPVHMAGNLFHIPGPPDDDFDDINNQGIFVNYYYPENYDPTYYRIVPKDYTLTTVLPVEVDNSLIWTTETGCPSGIDTGGGGEDPRTLMAESQQKIDSTETLLTMLVDGGNTQDLQTDVAHSFPPEAMAIYTELIDKSPYLSDTVVSTAIGKENVLVDAMIRDVMVANPHSAKNEELLNKLDDRWTPLPDYMVEQILQGRNLISVKEKTESQLARFMLDKTRAMSRLERAYRSDTANMQSSLDSLAMLYAADHTPESKYRLAFLQLERGEAVQGQATLNSIPSQFTLRPGQVDEHAKLVEYYSLLATFAGSAPDSAAVQALYDLSQQEPYHAAMYATNMLIALGEVQYEEPVIMPDYLKSARASGSQPGVDKTRKPQMLKVKPNPAKDFIIVEYELETGGNILIEVTDMSGKPVHSMQAINARDEVTIDTRNWKPGAHIVTLKLNGKPVESVKFTKTQ